MNSKRIILTGTIINPFTEEIFSGEVNIDNGLISGIIRKPNNSPLVITTGYIDAHNHIESSLLTPKGYASLALARGVIGSISDPHEIANVCGIKGVEYMMEEGEHFPFYFCWGAPSCVPATQFETSGGKLNLKAVADLLKDSRITHLSEVMNFPGVLSGDHDLLEMISVARSLGKQVDAHLPEIIGHDCWKYFQKLGFDKNIRGAADHECTSLAEALEKLGYGATISIREGSAAKNFEALYRLLLKEETKGKVLFCSDDIHPDYLRDGYIDNMVRRAIRKGVPYMRVLQAASSDIINHYNIPVGRLEVGSSADLIVLDGIESLNVVQTYVQGKLVAENGKCLLEVPRPSLINNFNAKAVSTDSISVMGEKGDGPEQIRVIDIIPEQLITKCHIAEAKKEGSTVVADTDNDILKIVVVNRYDLEASQHPSVAFVRGMGIIGAMASSVAHDSHNIIAVGIDDESICRAINAIIEHQGGLCLVEPNGGKLSILPLPIAGLMSDQDPMEVTKQYEELDRAAKQVLGSKLPAPFMTISFLALLVIKDLKISDLSEGSNCSGLFDGVKFEFTSPFVD